jgi:hypothetical protein
MRNFDPARLAARSTGSVIAAGLVGRHPADAGEVHRGKRAARIESIPSEPQQQAARRRDRQIVRQHGSAAVPFEPAADAGSRCDRARERDKAADRVSTVDPAKSWKLVPTHGRKLPALPMVARNPSGPHVQWPIIG